MERKLIQHQFPSDYEAQKGEIWRNYNQEKDGYNENLDKYTSISY